MTETTKTAPRKSTRKFQAEVSRVLHLVINSLYSHKDIFLRELISNASDALDKLKLQALADDSVLGDDGDLLIRVWADAEAGLVHIEDNGVGMTRDELATNLGTVAHSGTLDFLANRSDDDDARLIGQFGVGFYSAFLVADRVDVVSKAVGSDEAWRWTSSGEENYVLEADQREGRGTTITLHLRDDQREYLQSWKLRSLIEKYSDYVAHPILLPVEEWEREKDDEGNVVEGADEWKRANKAAALWKRTPGEVTDEQYEEFYKHLSSDFEAPLARKHFRIEGTQLFDGLLFMPSKAPFDLFQREHQRGVRLFVQRVFIMDDAEELVPTWLRFIKGVIDSDDLPLNVSREILQDSAVTRSIKKQVIKKTLDMVRALKNDEDEPERFDTFWTNFGAVFKEGIAVEPDFKDKIAGLCRFHSSAEGDWVTLDDYIERMPEGQESLYYLIGESEDTLAGSPHLEILKKKGYEVLFMTDPIDQWVVESLRTWDDKPLVSAAQADLKLGEDEGDEEAKQARENQEKGLEGLVERFGAVLSEQVSEVRLSKRLTDSPSCLVTPEGGTAAWIERMLRAQDKDMPRTKRIMELNPSHPLIVNLQKLHDRDTESSQVSDWIDLLYQQALLTEGSPVENPLALAQRMTVLLEQASTAALADV